MTRNILEVFIIIADSGSFEKASKQLFVSSTALIKQMNRLESELGFKLFSRTNKGIVLTPSGKIFYESANRMLDELYHTIQQAQDLEQKQSETLRLGISMINPYQHVTDKFHYHTDFFSQSSINVVPINCEYSTFCDQINNLGRDVDIIPYFLGNQDWELNCDTYCLAKFPFRIAVPASHPLYAKETISLPDLAGEKLITLSGNINRYYKEINEEITRSVSDIRFQYVTFFDYNIFDYAIKTNSLLLVGDYLKNTHPFLSLRPIALPHTLPYGIYYSKSPSELVLKLLDSFQGIGKGGDIETSEVIEF